MKNEPIANLIGYYALIGGVLAVVLGYFVVKPALNSFQLNSQNLAIENAKIAQLDQAAKDTDALRESYTTPDSTGMTIQQQRNRILAQLPPSDQSEQLMNLLSVLGAQSGVVVSSYIPRGNPSSSGGSSGSYLAFPVDLNFSGTFPQMQNFIKSLERSARFIDIEGINVSTSNNGQAAMTATLSLQAYYQQNPPSGVVGSQQ